MEQMGLLDPEDDVDIFCLHYVAEHLIQAAAVRFQRSWNDHKIRTEGHKSPNQIFIAGLTALRKSGSAFSELEQVRFIAFVINNILIHIFCFHRMNLVEMEEILMIGTKLFILFPLWMSLLFVVH